MQCDKLTISFADVAQLVVQLIRNQQVAGPSPAISSKKDGRVRLFVLLQSGTQTKVLVIARTQTVLKHSQALAKNKPPACFLNASPRHQLQKRRKSPSFCFATKRDLDPGFALTQKTYFAASVCDIN